MIQAGYVSSSLIALAILLLGVRFWLAPASASAPSASPVHRRRRPGWTP